MRNAFLTFDEAAQAAIEQSVPSSPTVIAQVTTRIQTCRRSLLRCETENKFLIIIICDSPRAIFIRHRKVYSSLSRAARLPKWLYTIGAMFSITRRDGDRIG